MLTVKRGGTERGKRFPKPLEDGRMESQGKGMVGGEGNGIG